MWARSTTRTPESMGFSVVSLADTEVFMNYAPKCQKGPKGLMCLKGLRGLMIHTMTMFSSEIVKDSSPSSVTRWVFSMPTTPRPG